MPSWLPGGARPPEPCAPDFLSARARRRPRLLLAAVLNSSPAQRVKEGAVSFQVSLPPAPGAHPGERDAMPQRNRHRHGQALPVVPMIEGGQSIPAGVGGRQCQRLRGAPRPPHRSDAKVLTNAERPAGELDEEGNVRVNVAVSVTLEADRGESAIEVRPAARRAEHEVCVAGQVRPPRVQMGARPAREHRADARPPKGIAHGHRDVGKRGSGREPHSGLPARRGRRLSRSDRARMSASGSSRRSRYRSSSRRAWARGFSR